MASRRCILAKLEQAFTGDSDGAVEVLFFEVNRFGEDTFLKKLQQALPQL